MQAIETKYIGPTATKGSRIAARCEAGRIVSTKHQMRATNVEEDHRLAAVELITKLGWFGHWVQAAVPSNRNGYVFVCYQRHGYKSNELISRGPIEGFDVFPESEVTRLGLPDVWNYHATNGWRRVRKTP